MEIFTKQLIKGKEVAMGEMFIFYNLRGNYGEVVLLLLQ